MSSSSKLKVVTVTLNPALDLTGDLDTLQTGTVNLVQQSSLHPAGKGVNVAKVLAELGADVTVTGLLGADNQDPFRQLFKSSGMTDKFVRVQGASRINVKLVEQSGQVSDINFPGVAVTQDDITRFEQMLFQLAETQHVFVFAGSLPKGLSPETCANWISRLSRMDKQVLFDSSNGALSAGLKANPWLVKPNQEELSEWAGNKLVSESEVTAAAEQLALNKITNVVVSLGSLGVMWLNREGWLCAKPPKVQIVSTVGAGDTLVAGLCWGHLNNWNKAQTLRFATALSVLAVTQVGVGVAHIDPVLKMEENIEIYVYNMVQRVSR